MQLFDRMESENLVIDGFLGFRETRVQIRPFTSLIGPQASGKSVIAKLVFFFRNYIEDLYIFGLESQDRRADFNIEQCNRFENLFPEAWEKNTRFKISYQYKRTEIDIEKNKNSNSIKIKLGKNEEQMVRSTHREYRQWVDAQYHDERRYTLPSTSLFFRENNLRKTLPSVLHVPAGRAFLSNIHDNVFLFLSEEDRIDPVNVEFGTFFEWAKKRYSTNRFEYT